MSDHATLDFETYSEAGFIWDEATQKYHAPPGAKRKGLFAVGASVYTEHPSAEVLTMSYRLPVWFRGGGRFRWRPGMPLPQMLFDFIAAGGLVEAHKAMFERFVWENICVPKYGFPPLPPHQQRCSMAKARVNSLPGALADLSSVLRLTHGKDPEGKRLIDKFSIPRNPTKKDARRRIRPEEDPIDAERLYGYCDRDIEAEDEASGRMPDMSPAETEFWLIDQEINHRGLAIDRAGVRDCIAVLEQALARYGDECRMITGLDPTQLQALRGWLAGRGCHLAAMDDTAVEEALSRPLLPPDVKRVLELRQLIGSASVKKLYQMENTASRDDRIRDLIVHHGARTGRPTGEGAQPLNMPRTGPKLLTCTGCAKPFRKALSRCPWCAGTAKPDDKGRWSPSMIEPVLDIMSERSLELVEWYFGDALLCIAGCLRGLFRAGPGKELIASDYSAIEAVVIAMISGEGWRIKAFLENAPIYLLGASNITGKSLQFYLDYFAENQDHHEDRQYIGKVSELALGFGGWIGAWRAMEIQQGITNSPFTDDDIKKLVLKWRAASPAIVELWGGQFRGLPWDPNRTPELFGFEGAAIKAIQNPGVAFDCRGILFYMAGDALKIRLLSGRELTYHNPRLTPSTRREDELSITYWTWNSNPKYGSMGWVCMSTFGGRLTENIVQATAHDILRFAIVNLRAAGYPTVLHVYDEIVVEVPAGAGSIEEVERIMATLPAWAAGWPIVAAGGWRGVRYRKG